MTRHLALAVLCAGQLMIVVDQNIVNVALPALQESLGFSPATLVWVVNAYVIPFGGLLLLAGRLGDLVGRRGVFVTGIAVFSAASLLCGFATSEATLVAFRFLQGIGGAVASACVLGMVATMASDPRGRARAIGAYSFASAGGGAVGPLLGGVLVDVAGWQWIFFINVPVGVAVVVLALRFVAKDTGARTGGRVDVLGAVLATAGLMLVGYAIADTAVLPGVLAAVLLAGFVVRQARAASPLVPPRMLRIPGLVAANLVQFLMIAGMFGLLFFGTLYVQQVLGYDSLTAGLGFVPIAVVIAAISLGLSARLILRFGHRAVLRTGLGLIIVAFLLLSLARVDGTYAVDFLPATLVMGLGFGLAAPAVMGLGMAAVTPEDSGMASGLFNTTQQVGGAIGLAVLSATAAGADGYRTAFGLAAGFVGVALLVEVVSARAVALSEA